MRIVVPVDQVQVRQQGPSSCFFQELMLLPGEKICEQADSAAHTHRRLLWSEACWKRKRKIPEDGIACDRGRAWGNGCRVFVGAV